MYEDKHFSRLGANFEPLEGPRVSPPKNWLKVVKVVGFKDPNFNVDEL